MNQTHAQGDSDGEDPHTGSRVRRLIDAMARPHVRPWVVAVILASIGLISWLDVATGPGREPAALYDIPIILSGAALDWVGAVAAAAVSSAACTLTLLHHDLTCTLADFIQSGMYFVLGLGAALVVTAYRNSCTWQGELEHLNSNLERRIAEAVEAQRQAQQKLLQSQRFTTLGEVAAQIAHEIKNPLVSIGGFARRAQKQLPEGHSCQTPLRIITEETTRPEVLLQELLEFGRPTIPSRFLIEPADLIDEVLVLARQAAHHQPIELMSTRKDPIPPVRGDRDQLKRALLNIVLNGIQAMPEGGRLTTFVASAEENGMSTVSIEVKDSGTGIDPELLPRIFEPFFTTKRNGTGLGLPLVRKTMEAHGGSVDIASAPKSGTLVTIRLPCGSEVT